MDVLIFVLVDQSKSGASARAVSQADFPRESGCLDVLVGRTNADLAQEPAARPLLHKI
jgi:hypothetical protein